MSRSSPLVAPIIDEDFDLCISETNLPFPYSDHCSTGPPSLYEFDVADDYDDEEDDEEGGYFEGALEEEAEEGYEDEDDTLISEPKELLLDGDNDNDLALPYLAIVNANTNGYDRGHLPASSVSPKNRSVPSSRSRNAKQKQLNDLSDQLHSRLESIHDNNKNDPFSTPTAATPKTRPYYSRQSYSFDSNEGWHEEDEEDDEYKDEAIHNQHGLTGIIQTVTSSATSIAYAVGKHWSKVMVETSIKLILHTMHTASQNGSIPIFFSLPLPFSFHPSCIFPCPLFFSSFIRLNFPTGT